VRNQIGEIRHTELDGDPTLQTQFGNKFLCEATAQLHPWGDIVA
jgi:hypothetical protein